MSFYLYFWSNSRLPGNTKKAQFKAILSHDFQVKGSALPITRKTDTFSGHLKD